MSVDVNSGNRGLWIAVLINSGVVLSLVAYVITLSYSAGLRVNQIDVNTSEILQIKDHGSPGLADKIDSINKRMDIILQQNRDMSVQIDNLRMLVARGSK